ncbi:MAG: protein-methionine-sulfoxide reductase heme-binding subunit MsrQ [Rhodospirillales bacterium]|jgi:sulfoxide reductase heme-binding subunit YedZ|nr:protein-methionine-sulfoxide reductase heme-binding subunit MsrQ [Rhodospirillales bacterium]
MNTRTQRRIFKPLVFLISLSPFGWLCYALYSDTVLGTQWLTTDPVQKLDRELGDWTLIFIILSLAVRPLADILKRNELVAYRRMIGLFALFYAVLHVSSYQIFHLKLDVVAFLKDIAERPFITVGMIAFVALIPLGITSTKGMIRRLGKNWRKLHMLIYGIAILGVIHFYMMIRADFSRPYVYGAIILLLLGYRYWKSRRRNTRRPVATQTA